uniref:Uncharacterized protein n=1 Tax=Mastacembelus armatus TaxID=205130 RepID=A0A7N8XMZ8_9TELE
LSHSCNMNLIKESGDMRKFQNKNLIMPDWESQREKEILPYPDLAPVVWCFLKQTTTPRSWCLEKEFHPQPMGVP